MEVRYKKLLQQKRRFFRKEKRIFIEEANSLLKKFGYETNISNSKSILMSENLETTTSDYEYILMAHYDTGTIIPFWMIWLMKVFGINRQL